MFKFQSALIGLALLGSAFTAQQWHAQNSLISETRTFHNSHQKQLSQLVQRQPPLLAYIPTYYKDVQPILDKNCVSCHIEGGIAPFSLFHPKEAVEYAREAQFAVQKKKMPPWMPGGESPKFKDETKLTDDEIAVIANWAWAGAPLGKTTDAKPRVLPTQQNSKPDVVMDIGKAFVPNPELTDEYRCFVVDPKLESERFITGYNIIPSNKKIVHHVVIFTVEPQMVPELKKLEATADGRGGYECFGGPGLPIRLSAGASNMGFSIMGNWVPGSKGGIQYPKNTGISLKPGTVLVLQVHYNLLAGKGSDRTVAHLNLADTTEKTTGLRGSIFMSPVEIACPSGISSDPNNTCSREAAYKAVEPYQGAELTNTLRNGLLLTYCQSKPQHNNGISTTQCNFPVNADRNILLVQGHMHLLGQSIKLELNPDNPKTRKVILEIPNWDFHWQSGYWLENPIPISKGDTVRITCTWNNTPENQPIQNGKQLEPRYTVWGETTRDEMCLAGYTALPRN